MRCVRHFTFSCVSGGAEGPRLVVSRPSRLQRPPPVSGASHEVHEVHEVVAARAECTRWMMAADYFMCARAHDLSVPADLDALGTATIRYLVWLFGQFYGNKAMLKTMVGYAAAALHRSPWGSFRVCAKDRRVGSSRTRSSCEVVVHETSARGLGETPQTVRKPS